MQERDPRSEAGPVPHSPPPYTLVFALFFPPPQGLPASEALHVLFPPLHSLDPFPQLIPLSGLFLREAHPDYQRRRVRGYTLSESCLFPHRCDPQNSSAVLMCVIMCSVSLATIQWREKGPGLSCIPRVQKAVCHRKQREGEWEGEMDG